MSRRSKRETLKPRNYYIEGLSHEGRGIARDEGKTVFVHNGLPGEMVLAKVTRRKSHFDEADAIEIKNPNPQRQKPRCHHFGVCGGCSVQHMLPEYQRRHKEKVLLDLLSHRAGVEPEKKMEPIFGETWGYRRRARLSAKSVRGKGGLILGFRERNGRYVTDCDRCDVLDLRVGGRIVEIRDALRSLSVESSIPQIEVAASEDEVVLVIRHLKPLNTSDVKLLDRLHRETNLAIYLQSTGPESAHPLTNSPTELSYNIGTHKIGFLPTDFTQINHEVNKKMVAEVRNALDLSGCENVLDLFSGIGNFTIPLSFACGSIMGIEGSASLVERATQNAKRNVAENCAFEQKDLFDLASMDTIRWGSYERLLLDPPRSGAEQVVRHPELDAIPRIVYVSCNGETLIRDAKILCTERGYRLQQLGVMDMFPQTAHIEVLAVFEKR